MTESDEIPLPAPRPEDGTRSDARAADSRNGYASDVVGSPVGKTIGTDVGNTVRRALALMAEGRADEAQALLATLAGA